MIERVEFLMVDNMWVNGMIKKWVLFKVVLTLVRKDKIDFKKKWWINSKPWLETHQMRILEHLPMIIIYMN